MDSNNNCGNINIDMFDLDCELDKINYDDYEDKDTLDEYKYETNQIDNNIDNVNNDFSSIFESILCKLNNEIESLKNEKIKDSINLAQNIKNSNNKSFMNSNVISIKVSNNLTPNLKLFNIKKETLLIKDPINKIIKTKIPTLSKGSYTSNDDYPETISKIDDAGNFIKVNKKEGRIDIYHQSGNIIKIDKDGNTVIHIKGGLKFKVDGDTSFHTNGNMDLVVDGDFNIQASNITTQTKKNILNCDENITNNKHNLINTKKSEIKCLTHTVKSSNASLILSSDALIDSNLHIKKDVNVKGNANVGGTVTADSCDC